MTGMDAVLERCALCGCERIRHWFTLENIAIGRCEGCGQIMRADRPDRNAHVALHQSSQLELTAYARHSHLVGSELPFSERFLDLCARTFPRGSLLDVGCGAGEFLALAADRGFRPFGVEPAAALRAEAERRVPSATIEAQPIESADYAEACMAGVVLWDVIEHLIDPRGVLVRLRCILKPGGYLGVATLNHDSLLYSIYHVLRVALPSLALHFGSRLYNPFHTYYFTRRTLARLVRNAGFEICDHRGYEFPLTRLEAGAALKWGLRGVYLAQLLLGRRGEQYLFARRP